MTSTSPCDLALTGKDLPNQLATTVLSSVAGMEDLLLDMFLCLLRLGFDPGHSFLKLLDGLASFAGKEWSLFIIILIDRDSWSWREK